MPLPRLFATLFALPVLACASRQEPAVATEVPRVEEGVVQELGQEGFVLRTAEAEPAELPLVLAPEAEVVFGETDVGSSILAEGVPVRVFYSTTGGDTPVVAERVELLEGEEARSVVDRAAEPGPVPGQGRDILAPREPPAADPSEPGLSP